MTENPQPTPPEGTTEEVAEDRFVGDRDLTHWYSSAGRRLESAAQWLSTRLGPNGTLIIILVVGMVIAGALSVVVVQVYDSVTDKEGVAGLDRPLLEYALTLRSPVANVIVTAYTNIAGPIGMPAIAVISLLILGIRRRSWTPVIVIVAAGAGSLLMTIAGKDLVARVRPPLADAVPPYEYSPSFPSGHSLNAVVVAGVIAYLIILRQRSRRARTVTVVATALFAVTIGFSRVFLGLHWFTDVLAGWALGALWLALVITAHRLYLTVKKRHAALASAAGSPDQLR